MSLNLISSNIFLLSFFFANFIGNVNAATDLLFTNLYNMHSRSELKIHPWSQTQWDGFHLRSEAQELAQNAHDCGAGQL